MLYPHPGKPLNVMRGSQTFGWIGMAVNNPEPSLWWRPPLVIASGAAEKQPGLMLADER